VALCRTARRLVVISALAFVAGAAAPVAAAPAAAGPGAVVHCNPVDATKFRAAGQRYVAEQRFTDAGMWFVAATRSTRECRTPSAAILRARSLFQAGAAFALGGDSVRGLDLLREAQSQLNALTMAGERDNASEAHAILNLIADLIASIDITAQGSM
jgi:hypothetical protein